MRATAALCVLALLTQPAWAADDEPTTYVAFVQEPAARCVQLGGMQVLVKSTHPSRAIQIWLDRYQLGVGTGDRSRALLAPGGEPEPLGCTQNLTGAQEWRLARARFAE
ncbi:MAG: hypothetical protein LCH73_15955 [Proteobacteria bacterium]|nr:hypothetical protein [Pseudomonadota bacterium]